MLLPLSSNVYNNIKDLEICGFHKNRKIRISPERNIIFSSNKKNLLIVHPGLLYGRKIVL